MTLRTLTFLRYFTVQFCSSNEVHVPVSSWMYIVRLSILQDRGCMRLETRCSFNYELSRPLPLP